VAWTIAKEIDTYFDDVNILREDGLAVGVAVQNGNITAEEALANARLMAAAPAMLAACKRALAVLKAQGESVRPGSVLGALSVAIAQATGDG